MEADTITKCFGIINSENRYKAKTKSEKVNKIVHHLTSNGYKSAWGRQTPPFPLDLLGLQYFLV